MNAILPHPITDETNLPDILMGEETDVPVHEGFVVDSLEKGLWTASKVAAAQKAVVELSMTARFFHGKIDAWLEKSIAPHLNTVTYLSMLLRPFLEDRLMGVKARSITLPGYRVGFRANPVKVVVDETEAAIEYLEHVYPEAIQVKKEILKSALKPLLNAGKEIPGVRMIPGEEVLYVQEER